MNGSRGSMYLDPKRIDQLTGLIQTTSLARLGAQSGTGDGGGRDLVPSHGSISCRCASDHVGRRLAAVIIRDRPP